jgi:phosphonate dehydrogenase
VDVAACTAAGVVVSTTSPDLEAPFTAELALAQCLALLRHVRDVDAHTRADAAGGGAYVPPVRSPAPGGSLVGATVGLFGVSGALPLAISRALIALGVTTILCLPVGSTNVTGDVDAVVSAVHQAALPGQSPAPTVVLVSALPELLKSSDVVFMTTHDVTRRTRHVIDGAALATVKRGLLLVNAASGALIDEGAVAQALESGVLGGYACGGLARDERGLRSVSAQGVDYGGPFPAATHAALLASPHALLAASGTATAVLAAAQRVELEAARALAEALDGRVPSGAVNPTVPPRRPGAPPTSDVARAGGLASYLWCF